MSERITRPRSTGIKSRRRDTSIEARMLREILHAPGTDPSRLAAVTGLSPAVVGAALARLGRRGYISCERGVMRACRLPDGSPVPTVNDEDTEALIATYIAEHGVTRCPPAYAAPVTGAEPLAVPVRTEQPSFSPRNTRSNGGGPSAGRRNALELP